MEDKSTLITKSGSSPSENRNSIPVMREEVVQAICPISRFSGRTWRAISPLLIILPAPIFKIYNSKKNGLIII
jgi:hypothetical protein